MRIVAIGAGQAGLGFGIKLKKMGHSDFVIYEKGYTVGGVWRENTYPGVRCDAPSQGYCYSFAPSGLWKKKYSGGNDIRRYFERAARTFNVAQHVKLNKEVISAEWTGKRWKLEISDGTTDFADILVSATGVLHRVAYPDIPGLETFEGHVFHSAEWDHSVDIDGKVVGLVGAGSSAVQIVEAITDRVSKLVVFQRTAQWILKSENSNYPFWYRALMTLFPVLQRRAYKRWEAVQLAIGGGLSGRSKEQAAQLLQSCLEHLDEVEDPILKQKLTPDYPMGCKRLVIAEKFYEMIQRPNVSLENGRIAKVTPTSVVAESGQEYPLDVLVLATGFHASAYVRPMRMIGEGGCTLDEVWADGPVSYIGMSVPKMPNFFMLGGPPNAVNQLMPILTAEMQSDAILGYIRHIAEQKIAIHPRQDVVRALVQEQRAAGKETVWGQGCKSWYIDDKGVPHFYPFDFERFKRDTEAPLLVDHFEVRSLGDHGGNNMRASSSVFPTRELQPETVK